MLVVPPGNFPACPRAKTTQARAGSFHFVNMIISFSFYLKDSTWINGGFPYITYSMHYLCNQCLLPLKLWARTPLNRGVLDTTICDNVCQWLATCQWFSPCTPASFTNKSDRHDITEILLKVALNTINQTKPLKYQFHM
jgi:hypothetical protein